MKVLFKTISLFLLGIMAMPSFLLLFNYNDQKLAAQAYYCDTTYFDGTTGSLQPYYIEYDTYSKQDWAIQYKLPQYEAVNYANSCAPAAGTIVVGYYDIFYPNLVPNEATGMWYNNQWYFMGFSEHVVDIFNEIYVKMGTNTEAPGTSINQFKNGLTSYVNQQGYNISYTSCGAINTTTLQGFIAQEKPVVVFLNSYRYLPEGIRSDDGSQLMFLEKLSNNGHVVVCYGYREFYFTKDGNSWTERYLIVSFGDGSLGLIDINDMSQVDAAFAVTIS